MPTLITGVGGQDGRLLLKELSKTQNDLVGICNIGQKETVLKYVNNAYVIEADISDDKTLLDILTSIKPTEIYNLAGFSSVQKSWNNPLKTAKVNSLVPITILEWCLRANSNVKYIQATSSEIFGGSKTSPQNELTRLDPITPYGSTKAFAHLAVQHFRQKFGLQASSLILYNHESPLRNPDFVTRKITLAAVAIAKGSNEKLKIGDINANRDWGWAPDYVKAMRMAMDLETLNDYIIASGQSHTVGDVINYAFNYLGIYDVSNYIELDRNYYRDTDPNFLVGDISKAREQLKWSPSKNLKETIEAMVDFDLELLVNPEAIWIDGESD